MPMYWMMNNITRQIAEFLFRNLFFATKKGVFCIKLQKFRINLKKDLFMEGFFV